jgi:hypothetical protein
VQGRAVPAKVERWDHCAAGLFMLGPLHELGTGAFCVTGWLPSSGGRETSQ